MRNFSRPQPKKKFYFINNRIEANSLRVVDAKSQQVGVMSKQEALNIAQNQGVDLVLIAPKAVPPVAKIIDFKKFLYQEEKKQKEAKKGIKKSIVKDISLSLFIAEADFERLMKRAIEFLDGGNQVRLNLTLRGREMGKRNMAFELIRRFMNLLGNINISKEPRQEGRVIRAVVSRKK